MDVPAPGIGAVCGSCPEGYTGDALKCYGLDYSMLQKGYYTQYVYISFRY